MSANLPDLDDRLRRLAEADRPAARDLAERAGTVRSRAARRRRRRRVALVGAAVPVVVLLVLAASALTRGGEDGMDVRTGPGVTTAPTIEESASTPLGSAVGVSIRATPDHDLVDGDQVEVGIEGLGSLQSPMLAACAGDLTAENAGERCDLRPLDRPGTDPEARSTVEPTMTVTIRRTIMFPGNADRPYDCATEPDGCVLAVGEVTVPTRGAYTALRFRPGSPLPTPRATFDPTTGLEDDQPITVAATGLRRSSTYSIAQCTSATDAVQCGVPRTARSNEDGRLMTDVRAQAAIYGSWGRVDCTATTCAVVLREDYEQPIGQVAITFGDDVVAPVPRLSISPAGPYVGGQTVDVTGTGFPPGTDVGGQIGQCPDGKDTSIEERCTYSVLASTIVGDDGTFAMTVRIQATISTSGPCADETGCHLGWVLPHGPTIAKVHLDIAP